MQNRIYKFKLLGIIKMQIEETDVFIYTCLNSTDTGVDCSNYQYDSKQELLEKVSNDRNSLSKLQDLISFIM